MVTSVTAQWALMAAFVRITLMTVYLTLATTIHCARMESITTRVFVSLVSLQPKLVTGIIYTCSFNSMLSVIISYCYCQVISLSRPVSLAGKSCLLLIKTM